MIFGIGTDIVSVERMRSNIEKYGPRFAQRILTDDEMADYNKVVNQANFLAKRFAAKEAAVKAMGTGFINGVSLHHISIGHTELGKPVLNFAGIAAEFIKSENIRSSHVSLADEYEYAVAFVTLSL
ncbi:MAG: holo-ACP synthase [Gammaproteobacteria bacterium]|nr:holo-ACP synthase [Gammaproteobacteria bacterium]